MSKSREAQFISIIRESLSETERDFIGDDCAVIDNNLLVSTDSMVEGVHFLPDANPYDIGWKLAAVNISDIAAMGGHPKYLTVAASLRKDCTEQNFRLLLKGILDCCRKYKVALVGGDLTASDKTYLSATIIGQESKFGIAKRNLALKGHKILVTGNFGSSAAGLWGLKNQTQSVPETLKFAHLQPQPRVKEGNEIIALCEGNLSMMDASDGLLDCLQQISQQSKVCLKVDFEKIPLSDDFKNFVSKYKLSPINLVLIGGEDFELVATVPKEALAPKGWTEIGEVVEGEGVVIISNGSPVNLQELAPFEHFLMDEKPLQ